MRVLVAGWHGQVAFALSEAAARRQDIEAYAVGRPALDLTDHPSVGRTLLDMAPDVIINTAAYTDVEAAETEPEVAFKRNQRGAEALAHQAKRSHIPIIHLSTVYVFDGDKQSAYTETDPPRPINAYGRSKNAGEAAVAKANPQHIILRTGWIYSPFGRNFVRSVLQRGLSEKTLAVDAVQRGSPTYAPHVADAVLQIAADITGRLKSGAGEARWGTYHIADQGTARWCDLASHAFGVAADRGATVPEIDTAAAAAGSSNKALRPVNATLDCTKLAATFGIRLPPWQDAVRDCVRRLG